MDGIEERLDAAEQIIRNPEFRHSGEFGERSTCYVFDYPVETELIVRKRVAYMVRKNHQKMDGYKLVVFDLYDILIDLLEREGFLEQCFKFEKGKGMERIVKAIGNLLLINEEESLIIRYIQSHTPKEAVVLLIGIGQSGQFLLSSKVLNGLTHAVDHAPVILFYPGDYQGREAKLLGTFLPPAD